MADISLFHSGPANLLQKFNDLIRVVNSLNNISGGEFVRVRRTGAGLIVDLSIDKLLERLPQKKGGTGTAKQYAVIVETLRREDPESSAPEAIDHYHIELLTDQGASGGPLDAYVLGYSGTNLLQVIPWFQVGDIVEVVHTPDYSESSGGIYEEIPGSEEWRICETVIKVEELILGVPYYSIYWNQDETRVMAVFR